MSTPRPLRPKAVSAAWAAAALVLVAAVGLVPLLAGATGSRAGALSCLPAAAALLAGLIGWRPGPAVAALALGVGYGLTLHGRGIDPAAPLLAIGIWAVAECGYASVDAREEAPETKASLRRRLAHVAVVAGVSAVAGAVMLAVAASGGAGPVLTVVALAAAVGALAAAALPGPRSLR